MEKMTLAYRLSIMTWAPVPLYIMRMRTFGLFHGRFKLENLQHSQKEGHNLYDSDTEVRMPMRVWTKVVENRWLFFWRKGGDVAFLARDRIGKKPLYYVEIGDSILFSSEIKSILEFQEIKREVNLKLLSHYLSCRSTPNSATLFNGINKLPPGSVLFKCGMLTTIKNFWKLPEKGLVNSVDSGSVETFLNLFDEAVRKRMISDVPIGAYLSGGIDSSSVWCAPLYSNLTIFVGLAK
jgi:asparagine synthetase B (glutamine-hydrolysing)